MHVTFQNRALGLFLLCLVAGPAVCATSCSLAVGNLAFGAYDVFNPVSLDSSASLVITCSRVGGPPGSVVSIAIGPSTSGGITGDRRMQVPGAADFLSYNLFRDATRTSVWGNIAGVDTFVQAINVPNRGTAQVFATMFGRIFAGQDVRSGNYTDTVLVTVSP